MTQASSNRSTNRFGDATPTASAASGGVKETVEQILVAFILAFVFRCYIVEAFVIPTGSMAPTLLGAHMNFRCPDCGYRFSVNYNAQLPNGSLVVPDTAAETYPIRCPNCAYRFPLTSQTDPDNDATAAAVQYGDRILVQKYIYLLHEPERWDVVVFKNPDNPSAESERYQDNYIKRLIGTPGETIMLLDGDVYVSTNPADLGQLKPTDFTVQTKSDRAQSALWRVVYDDDYRPRGLPRDYPPSVQNVGQTQSEEPWRQPWRPDDARAWNLAGHAFRFDGLSTTGRITYDATSMDKKFPLTDWLAYDVSHMVDRRVTGTSGWNLPGYKRNETPINNVSDIKLAASYRRLNGDGDLRLSTTKQDRTFVAVIGQDEVRLEMKVAGGSPVVIGRVAMHAGQKHPAQIELANADYRVTLKVDGSTVAETTPEQFAPNIAALLDAYEKRRDQDQPHIQIEASNQACELEHVSLWRDVYYLNNPGRGFYWAMPGNFPAGDSYSKLVRLGADEFFVLGDNSMLSGDARFWKSAIALPYEGNFSSEAGRVPRRFMLGRAFFVYWPAGFAPVSALPAFVPNFGEMRFIH